MPDNESTRPAPQLLNRRMSRPPQILLLTNDPLRRETWRAAISALTPVLGDTKPGALDSPELDLVVVDGESPPRDPPCRDKVRNAGIVTVGGTLPANVSLAADVSLPADVSLAADCSPRELHLACELLLQIVRLRRSLRAQNAERKILSEQALTDPLTGLANRRAWDETVASVEGRDVSGCVAILDLDFFKQINDRNGHAIGDQVLREVGQELRTRTRRGDLAARMGGDEFALLLVNLEPDRALSVVDRVRQAVGLSTARAGAATTASAGLTVFSQTTGCPAKQLLDAADRALRQAKALGRDRTIAAPVVHPGVTPAEPEAGRC